VEFRSHIDGSKRQFTPESVMRIERNLGADVIMQFDHVVPGQSEHPLASEAMERSVRWLARCLTEFERLRTVAASEGPGVARAASDPAAGGAAADDASLRGGPPTGNLPPDESDTRTRPPQAVPPNFDPEQTLFPIVQGGIHADLRRESAVAIAGMHAWDGFGIGGLSVGEAKPDMYAMLDVVDEALPRDRPRYLMGVGFPDDLVEGVRRGVDLFDCVAPTRMGRNGTAFTTDGRLNIKRSEFRDDPRPIDETCACPACLRFSRAYVRHLYLADEMFGLRLLSLHNVHFLVSLMHDARRALLGGTFDGWSESWLQRYHSRTR
jgi:queuine tRNA-ribosyltransferase